MIFAGRLTSPGTVVNETWILSEPALSRALASPAEPRARTRPSLAYAPALGGTVLFGGFSDAGAALQDTWLFDGEMWRELPFDSGAPSPRGGAAMAYDPYLGQVLLFGGATDINDASTVADLWALAPTGWTLLQPGPGPGPRTGASLALLPPTSSFVLFGGRAQGVPNNETWILRYQ